MTDVLVVGESLVDIVRRADGTSVEYAGGRGANVAVALARLGRPVAFVTAYADDERGAVLARHLNQSAVAVTGDPHALERTATALATLAADGSASYTFDIDWRLNAVPDLSPVVVHTCSLGAVLSPGADDVRRLLERQRPTATISYAIQCRLAVTGTGPDVVRAVEEVVVLADLVKASDEDLEALYPDATVEQSVAHLLGLGPAAVVVTRGCDGATWFHARGEWSSAPSTDVEVADTIGAGDTFGAAMLDAPGPERLRRPPRDARRLRDRDRAASRGAGRGCDGLAAGRRPAVPPRGALSRPSVDRAQLVGVGDRLAAQPAVGADGVLPHPPQRRAVGVHRDGPVHGAGQPVDVVGAEAEDLPALDTSRRSRCRRRGCARAGCPRHGDGARGDVVVVEAGVVLGGPAQQPDVDVGVAVSET